MVDLSEQAVFEKVKAALQAFLEEDMALLDVNASERSVSHKLAEHLQRQFDDHHVDCEYNRHGKEVKRAKYYYLDPPGRHDLEAKAVLPDIIVHTRGKRYKHNLLVIEMKKSNSGQDHGPDHQKLRAFTSDQYKYEYGLFLVFDVQNASTTHPIKDIQSFKNGERQAENTMWSTLKELAHGG